MSVREHLQCFCVTALLARVALWCDNAGALIAFGLAFGAYLGIRMGATHWR